MKARVGLSKVLRIKRQITDVFQRYAAVSRPTASSILSIKDLHGKLYEIHVLATICKRLAIDDGLQLKICGSSTLRLKLKGGPINRTYAYFEVRQGSAFFGELFTDIYFDTISHERRGFTGPKIRGDYHEIDIGLFRPRSTGNPGYKQILLAVECKNTSIKKSIIREILGFRREMTFIQDHFIPTSFTKWPTDTVRSDPGSVHMLYCSDRRVSNFTQSCKQFDIIVEHHSM
jgi:hypothetical protein